MADESNGDNFFIKNEMILSNLRSAGWTFFQEAADMKNKRYMPSPLRHSRESPSAGLYNSQASAITKNERVRLAVREVT